ncbi:hypothetical protein [Nonomuraea sp. NPDC049400]|uniref:hypothetical protein n=1 Tax=Nonomuraea sp. NPDC049400 TaxID=3364352 RepID=UPI00378A1D93
MAAVVIAAAVAAAAVVAWYKLPRAAASVPIRADVTAAAGVLAGMVRRQWEAEARHRSLDDPEPMPVRWQLTSDEAVMSHPRLISQAEFAFAGRSDDITALARDFRALTRRRLVITGGPGTGKTTLAVQLLLRLLATRTADQAAAEAAENSEVVPVPVLLPVSGWNLQVHPRLQGWLADRLNQDYPALNAPEFGPGAAAALVDGGHILPVLDGLDEIGEHAAEVIAALNASLNAGDQLIVTSRTAEFASAVTTAGRPLTGAAVIVPAQLSPQAAADYLRACLPAHPTVAWQQVLDALEARTVTGLTALATTPLGLWLLRTIYTVPGADPSILSGPLGSNTAALRAHLLDRLIPALIVARPPGTEPGDHFRPRHRLDPDATRRYLTYLARAFSPSATRDIVWWRVTQTSPRLIRGLTRATIGLGVGLSYGLVGLPWVLVPGGENGVLVFVLVFAGLAAGGGSLAAKDWYGDVPGHANFRLRGRVLSLFHILRQALLGAIIAGLGVGGMAAYIYSLATKHSFGSVSDLPFALLGGVGIVGTALVCIAEWAEVPTSTSVSTPLSTWRSDRALILVRILAHSLMSGLIVGIGVAVVGGVAPGLTLGLAAGVTFGLFSGIYYGGHHAWVISRISLAWLAVMQKLPVRFLKLLDDAHRLGLLRAVGPVYQFRHGALHDYLAAVQLDQD